MESVLKRVSITDLARETAAILGPGTDVTENSKPA
jgi:hypothetical protein